MTVSTFLPVITSSMQTVTNWSLYNPPSSRARLPAPQRDSAAALLLHHGHPVGRARGAERGGHRLQGTAPTLLNFILLQLCQVYYSTTPQLSLSQWESQFVDNNKLTTISDLTPHTIYTIRVEAYTSIGPGPLSTPVQVIHHTTHQICSLNKTTAG